MEIKSTGIEEDEKPEKRGKYRAKERISLAIVDFKNIKFQSFEESVWTKIKDPLFVIYDYESRDIHEYDKKIVCVDFYEYSEFEKEMIYKEWEKIRDVVIHHGGQYVSQRKLKHNFLEPTTTGATSEDLVENIDGNLAVSLEGLRFPTSLNVNGQANRIVKNCSNMISILKANKEQADLKLFINIEETDEIVFIPSFLLVDNFEKLLRKKIENLKEQCLII